MNETEPPKKPYKIRLKEISNLQKKFPFLLSTLFQFFRNKKMATLKITNF